VWDSLSLTLSLSLQPAAVTDRQSDRQSGAQTRPPALGQVEARGVLHADVFIIVSAGVRGQRRAPGIGSAAGAWKCASRGEVGAPGDDGSRAAGLRSARGLSSSAALGLSGPLIRPPVKDKRATAVASPSAVVTGAQRPASGSRGQKSSQGRGACPHRR
jgi:hypothetical protein